MAAANIDLTVQEKADGHQAFSDRIPALDGVRGLALIQVLLLHFALLDGLTGGTVLDKFISQLVDAGWIAMDSFFVLSGFLITGILYDAKAGRVRNYYRNFYVRRSLRIFPAHYVFLAALVLLLPVLQPDLTRVNDTISRDWGWFAGYVGNFRVALDHGQRPDLLFTGHLWSLAVEEQFYVIWPVFVLLLNRRRLMILCVVAVALAFFIRTAMVATDVNRWVTYPLMVTRMDSLAIGALLALAVRDPADFAWLKRWLPSLALAAGLLIAVPALLQGELYIWGDWSLTVVHTAVSVVYAFLIFTAASILNRSGPNRILGTSVLVTLGRYSYSMYLVHVPIAFLLSIHTDFATSMPRVLGSYLPGQLAFATVAFAITLAIGWTSWRFLEGPSLSLKRYFPYTGGEEAARHGAPQLAAALEGQPAPP